MWFNTSTWRWLKPFVLRSTSIPIEMVLNLRLKESIKQLNEWSKSQQSFDQWCNHWIKEIRSVPVERISLPHQRKVIRRIKKRNPLTEQDKIIVTKWGMEKLIDEYCSQQQSLISLKKKAQQSFHEEFERLQQQLIERFQSSQYELALYTLNHKLWHFWIKENRLENLTDAQKKQTCRTLFAYLQRVSTKNDTIGEYGPISYGAFNQGKLIQTRQITKRKAYFAYQGLQKLLSVIKKDLMPQAHAWNLPSSTVDGWKLVRERVEDCNDPRSEIWIRILDQLEETRHLFETSTQPNEKEQALAQAEKLFTNITGEAFQGENQQYFADKTLLYEECHDQQYLPVTLSVDLWTELDHALLIHAKLRLDIWRSWQNIAVQKFEQLANGNVSIPLMKWVSYWLRYPPSLDNQSATDLLSPWLVDRNGYLSIKLPDRVIRSWRKEINSFRWLLSPDLMVKGKFETNRFNVASIVIGELHHGFTADGWMFEFHPDKKEINRIVRQAMPEKNPSFTWANWIFQRKMKSTPQEYPGVSVKLTGHSEYPDEKSFSLYDLEVRRLGDKVAVFLQGTDNALMFYPPAYGFNETSFFPFALFCSPMMEPSSNYSKGRHKAIKLGNVTLIREHWVFEPTDWGEVHASLDGFQQMACLQEIKVKYQLPQVGYLRFSQELKPVWFDFNNPFCVDLFFNMAKKAEWFTFSRMDPGVEDLFLKDDRGHYCCELRTFAYRQEITSKDMLMG
ncbi:BH2034 [Halalkalibacterium halodurans C-125]|uniref:BH2034 protein n=3 Tax=Halalkalibacterium halodurans TaxID=86665 RepID=Q9KB94_HALH5|nr:BH2034 [Halalkalibacterium halodurans C-125]